jgi:hypothetical protein
MRTKFAYFLVVAHGMDVVIEMLILVYSIPHPFRKDETVFIYSASHFPFRSGIASTVLDSVKQTSF